MLLNLGVAIVKTKVDREVDAGRIVSVSMSTSTWPVGRAGPMLVSSD